MLATPKPEYALKKLMPEGSCVPKKYFTAPLKKLGNLSILPF
jgi:hypothetical protein